MISTPRIIQWVVGFMIFIMASSEVTRFTAANLGYAINVEIESEESSDSNSKSSGFDSYDEIAFSVFTILLTPYALHPNQMFFCIDQALTHGVCKIHLEPPDARLIA
ncbi:MAG: hypothetical protein RLZZ242_839 [Bacteroidota bacterium]